MVYGALIAAQIRDNMQDDILILRTISSFPIFSKHEIYSKNSEMMHSFSVLAASQFVHRTIFTALIKRKFGPLIK